MEYTRDQMAVLVEQVKLGVPILLNKAEDVKRLDKWLRELTCGAIVTHVNVLEYYYEVTTASRLDKTQDVYVSLDADHIVYLKSVLSRQHTALFRQKELLENGLRLLDDDLEDVHILERKIEVGCVTRQDMETLDVIEHELDEIHKSI